MLGDATALPIEDASVDFVLMIEVAFHIADKDRLFAEIARVLRPGGRLILVDQERRAGDITLMDIFHFVAFESYARLGAGAGLEPEGFDDLSAQVGAWCRSYARVSGWHYQGAIAAWTALRGRPGLAWRYLSGLRYFGGKIRDQIRDLKLPTRPLSNHVKTLRNHTAHEFETGASRYGCWTFRRDPR